MAGRGCPLCAALGQGDNDYVVSVYLTLGNTVPHLHTHVVPRYLDDPAPGGPIEWAQIFSPEPVPDAELRRQASVLRARLAG